MSNITTTYSVDELTNALQENKTIVSVVYGVYDYQNGNLKNISVRNLINFLYENKSNPFLSDKLSTASTMLDLTYKIVNNTNTRYTYKEMRIDNAIFEKNIQDQEERLNTARKKLGEAQAKTTELEAKWDAKIKTLLVEAENDAKVIMSKADLYEGEKKAQGDLLVSKAIAESQKLKADALKQSGADMYVTKELAPMVKSLKGGVVNGVDPYNLKTWMSKFGFNANGSVNRGE